MVGISYASTGLRWFSPFSRPTPVDALELLPVAGSAAGDIHILIGSIEKSGRHHRPFDGPDPESPVVLPASGVNSTLPWLKSPYLFCTRFFRD